MISILAHAPDADCNHAFQAHLAIQLLTDGTQSGNAKIISILVKHDVHDLVRIRYIGLNLLHQAIHSIRDIVIHLK